MGGARECGNRCVIFPYSDRGVSPTQGNEGGFTCPPQFIGMSSLEQSDSSSFLLKDGRQGSIPYGNNKGI